MATGGVEGPEEARDNDPHNDLDGQLQRQFRDLFGTVEKLGSSESSDDDSTPMEEDEVGGEKILREPEEIDGKEKPPDKYDAWSLETRLSHLQQKGYLSRKGRDELLFLDTHEERFFVIDGDSLLLDASLSQTWRRGQQYHLFHLIELKLKQFRDHGGVFRIVFFKDCRRFWNFSPYFLLYRDTLIQHLRSQCAVTVYTEWSNFLDHSWSKFLKREKPQFFCQHSGFMPHRRQLAAALNVMAYSTLASDTALVLVDSVHLQKTNLYGILFSPSKSEVKFWKTWGRFLTDLASLSLTEANFKEGETVVEYGGNAKPVEGMSSSADMDAKGVMKRLLVGCVSQLKVKRHAEVSDESQNRIRQWCLYFAVKAEKSLGRRLAFAPPSQRKGVCQEEELNLFVACLHAALNHESRHIPDHQLTPLLCDLIDAAVFDVIVEGRSRALTSDVGEVCSEFLEALDMPELAESSVQSVETQSFIREDCEKALVFPPFGGPIITSFAKDVMEKFCGIDRHVENVFGQVYQENYHWHVLKELKDVDERMDRPKPANLECKKKMIRANQKYTDFMMNYGLKLTGYNQPKTIVTQKVSHAAKRKALKQESDGSSKENDKQLKERNSKKQQKKPQSKKEQIIAQNKSAKQAEETKKLKEKWRFVKANLEKKSYDEKLRELRDMVKLDKNIDHQESHQMLLSVLFERWEDQQNLDDAAALVKELQNYASMASKLEMNLSLLKEVVKYFFKLGFTDEGKNLHQKHFPERNFPTTKKPCPIGLTYIEFQMLHMGPLMSRNDRFDPDPRVEGFIPDTWQRKLLDAIDNSESALIVAPTSSGKTFCSFYCIEKVLRESDDGLIVYVAPTKALVNQVSATIHAKYSKQYKEGKCLTGTFTRDYKQNSENCQVLVTVPQCLEILLLSPKRQSWAKNLEYVILDEVHCLGGETGGEVWEHLLLMIQCPFLALSATIGHPSFFHGWLERIATFKNSLDPSVSPVVKFVEHGERYSDIEMSVFHEESKTLQGVHPFGFLDPNLLAKKGFPESLKLSAIGSHTLFTTAIGTLGGDDLSALHHLKPEVFFQSKNAITKADAREFETKVKETLRDIMVEKTGQARSDIAEKLIQGIASAGDAKDLPRGIAYSEGYTRPRLEVEEMYDLFPILMDELRKEKKIPVIVFRCNRTDIELLAEELRSSVSEKLDQDEKLQTLLQERKKLESRLGDISRDARDRKVTSPDSRDTKPSESEMDVKNDYDKCVLAIKRRMSRFTFSDPHGDDSADKAIEKASEKMQGLLKFGIGYHHGGCGIHDRRAVEMLFRMGKIQVVIATSTLALGIHMPCKAVVFVGDDYYVDALGFRQMSGRSGRRGFDNIGHVVFFGVPSAKVSRLIEANITQLQGRHPISLSFVLRLFLLQNGAEDKHDAELKILSALRNPFLAHESPENLHQVKLYFLFSCDVMFRHNLIDLVGTPLGYAGMMTHLHYHEPGNLFLVKLLEMGIFEQLCVPTDHFSEHDNYNRYACKSCKKNLLLEPRYICQICSWSGEYFLCKNCYSCHAGHGFGKNVHEKKDFVPREAWLKQPLSEDSLRDIVEVLCHLFCHKRIPETWLTQTGGKKAQLLRKPTFGSKVLLPPMSEKVHAAVTDLNRNIRSLFVNFLRCVTKDQPQSVIMPFSHLEVFRDHDQEQPDGISLISRLSGCENSDLLNQDFSSEDFQRLLPHSLRLTSEMLPSLNTGIPKNSYALDFFKHGSLKALMFDNGLKAGDLFDMLNDFFLTIRTISTALEQIPEQELLSNAFKHLCIVFEVRFRKVWPNAKTSGF